MNQTAGTRDLTGNGPSAATSEGLVGRVRRQLPDGWLELTERYSPLVYRWCRQTGLGPEDAADVVQEVFLAVTRRITSFRHDRPQDSLRGWLWTITRSKLCDRARHRRAEPDAEGGSGVLGRLTNIAEAVSNSLSSDPSRAPGGDQALKQRAVELVRGRVEERTWQAFWLLTADGLAVAEVAQRLDMTPSAVYKAKYRVVRLIRREYEVLGE